MILHRGSSRNKIPSRAGDDEKKIPRQARNDKTKSYMTKHAGQMAGIFYFLPLFEKYIVIATPTC